MILDSLKVIPNLTGNEYGDTWINFYLDIKNYISINIDTLQILKSKDRDIVIFQYNATNIGLEWIITVSNHLKLYVVNDIIHWNEKINDDQFSDKLKRQILSKLIDIDKDNIFISKKLSNKIVLEAITY